MSTFLDKIEKHFGNWAIPGLIKYLAILFVAVFLMGAMRPDFVLALDFNYTKILEGEFWRIFTFVLAPKAVGSSPLAAVFIVFATIFLFMFSDGLEQQWGVFRTNLYILWGFLSSLIANVIFAHTFGFSIPLSGSYLALSIMFAYATINPQFTFMLFFVIPCRIWVIAIVIGALTLLSSIGSLPTFLFILTCLSNYLIFGIPILLQRTKSSTSARIRRKKYASNSSNEPFNVCHHCGANDQTHPELEFRVSSKDGNTYCTKHLPK